MEKEALKRIFEFLEEKDEHRPPFMWKHMNDIPLTEDDLNIEGDLDLWAMNIKSLPKGLKVGGLLNLEFSTIQTLPKGLIVGGNLFLGSCKQLTSLPEGLKVGSFLDIAGTKISSLPKGLEVNSGIYIYSTELEKYTDDELRKMIKPGFIKGKINRR